MTSEKTNNDPLKKLEAELVKFGMDIYEQVIVYTSDEDFYLTSRLRSGVRKVDDELTLYCLKLDIMDGDKTQALVIGSLNADNLIEKFTNLIEGIKKAKAFEEAKAEAKH